MPTQREQELLDQAAEDAARYQRELSDKANEAALENEGDNEIHYETEEEYAERVAAARTAGIFGDTDTTAGAGASATDVPSRDNEEATRVEAEVDAGDESDDPGAAEARRQVDASATGEDAESVNEAADDSEEDNGEDGDESEEDESDPFA